MKNSNKQLTFNPAYPYKMPTRSIGTDTKDVDSDIIHLKWKNGDFTRIMYGVFPSEVLGMTKELEFIVKSKIKSRKFTLTSYFFPISFFLISLLVIFGFVIENWYLIAASLFFL